MFKSRFKVNDFFVRIVTNHTEVPIFRLEASCCIILLLLLGGVSVVRYGGSLSSSHDVSLGVAIAVSKATSYSTAKCATLDSLTGVDLCSFTVYLFLVFVSADSSL